MQRSDVNIIIITGSAGGQSSAIDTDTRAGPPLLTMLP